MSGIHSTHFVMSGFFLVLLIAAIAGCAGSPTSYSEPPYSAAFIQANGTIQAFPMNAKSFTVPVPSVLAVAVYGPRGESIYGFEPAGESHGMLRIGLNHAGFMRIPGTTNFRLVNGFAVSKEEDIAVVSARYSDGSSSTCGIFQVKLSNGAVEKKVDSTDCDHSTSWSRLNISPDAKWLVAYRKPQLELIDLTRRTVRSLGSRFIGAAWSPDGRWFAELEGAGSNRTVLLDSSSMSQVRTLRSSNLQWSPDSRFLLAQGTGHCWPYWSSLVTIDVLSGKETEIVSSACKVNLNTTGWINRSVNNNTGS